MREIRLATLREILADVDNIRKSQGVYAALVYTLKIIKERLILTNDMIVFAHALKDSLPEVKSVEGLTIIEATVDDLHLFEPVKRPSEIIACRRSLERGETCLIALQDNRLAGCVWFTPVIDLAVNPYYLPLTSDEVYMYNLETLPDFRHQGIGSVLVNRLLQLTRERGYKYVLALVGTDNTVSINFHEKLGYQTVGGLIRVKLFRLIYFQYRPRMSKVRHIVKCLGV